MTILSKEVEVLGVAHAVGALSGAELYQVGFGELGRPKHRPNIPGVPDNARIGAMWTVVFIPKGQPSPYALGSRWRLTVENDGTVRIEPREGRPGRRKTRGNRR